MAKKPQSLADRIKVIRKLILESAEPEQQLYDALIMASVKEPGNKQLHKALRALVMDDSLFDRHEGKGR